ncbi:MAG TPA: serine hydrolase domain-containing protein [Pyrinomonadaceae bacterium]|nr:serine hydrolase domain-containing protein [Pyrinomonadaceae bacterium]
MKIKILSAILFTFALFNAGFAQTLDKAKLDKFFDALAEKNKAMGSLALAKDGKILYSRAIGYSRISGDEKKASTVETKYRVGSIAKMFTAVMIFQLAEEGKLKLTDTLDKFYPQIPNAGKITIAQILSHKSGIHSFTSDPDFGTWLMNPKTKDEMVAIIAKSKPDFEPGEKMQYSNAGYVLLGYIVEKVTGKSYQTALKERITSKIGLSNTYLGSGKTDVSKNESFSFSYEGSWKEKTETDLSIPGGAGALISTPTDLAKFIHALFELKLVSQESLDKMKTEKMGMFPFPLGEKTLYGHTGGIDGFSSMLAYLPEEKLTIAYSSNGRVYPPNDILIGVFDVYYNKPFTIPTFETVAVSEADLEKYVGVYASEKFPLKITVTREGATLSAQATGQSAFPLEATAKNAFKFERAGIVLEFDAEKSQMTLKQGGRETVYTKEK